MAGDEEEAEVNTVLALRGEGGGRKGVGCRKWKDGILRGERKGAMLKTGTILHGLRSKSFSWRQTNHKTTTKTTHDLLFSTHRVDTHQANWVEDK